MGKKKWIQLKQNMPKPEFNTQIFLVPRPTVFTSRQEMGVLGKEAGKEVQGGESREGKMEM